MLSKGTLTVDAGTGFGNTFTISTTLNPSLAVGTIAYYQSGIAGTPKGLLLSLTNTPLYTRMIMTDSGLRRTIE